MVEIIPKPPEKIPLWQNLIFFLSTAILIIAIFSYFALGYFQGKARQEIEKLDTEIAKTETKERKDLKDYLLREKQKIDDFAFILNKHRASSNLFGFLESATHPNVWFTDLKLDTQKATVALSGEGEKLAFGQQLLIFQKDEKILETTLSKISLKEKEAEKVAFTLSLTLSPEIFKILK